jgi:tRNA threonylcarbamoyladenosine biosynthesis protein TsaE
MMQGATITLQLADEQATQKLGRWLAPYARPGDVIALFGTLGAGKTALARAMIRALTQEDQEVPSPTFTLVQTYDTPQSTLWHFDLYRLEQPGDVYELGFEDACQDICLIEWPERLGALLPTNCLEVVMEMSPHTSGRSARLRLCGHWIQDLGVQDLGTKNWEQQP